jgi:lipoyl(octanoyl) transferase
VDSKKIASIGLRITRGSSYHGLALNHNTDLKAFSGINTCGYKDLDIINMNDLGIDENKKTIQMQLAHYF